MFSLFKCFKLVKLFIYFVNIDGFRLNINNLVKNNINNKNLLVKSMNFNLNKDSLWLSYPVKRNYYSKLQELIPETHKLAKCKVFEEDPLDYRLFFNIFSVKTPFFNGDRLEIVTLIEDKINNKISFVVLDCFTNVIHWDPINGIQYANSKFKKLINNNKYNIEIFNKLDDMKIFHLKSNRGKVRKSVLKSFSVYPNYKCYFKNFVKGYNLKFNEKQIDKKVLLINNYDLNHDIYKSFIKDLEHIFIYTDKMDFKVYL